MTTNSGYYEYSGVLHIHSRHSDGSGTVRRIIKAAKKVDLDYIVITDHNTLQAMEDGVEGWHDNLLVLVGEEIGKPRSDHYLAFGISEAINPTDHRQDARSYIRAAKDQGGIGFAPHPYGLRNTSFGLRSSAWREWNDPDYTGLEIWSYMYDWAESVTLFNIFYYYFCPGKTINGPPPDLLKRWDQLCQTRRVVGIGGSDAHARHLSPLNFVKFLSYERAFRGIRTHLLMPSLLSPDLDESKNLVYNALGSGHCFFAHDSLADSTGFNFRAYTDAAHKLPSSRDGAGEFNPLEKDEVRRSPPLRKGGLIMGDEVETKSGVELEGTSPVPASLRLLHNGQMVKQVTEAKRLTWKASEPGAYRIEARYNGRPWVFTNPIYVRESISLSVY